MTAPLSPSDYHSWFEEKQSSYLYRCIAKLEPDQTKRQLFEKLAVRADAQAAIIIGKRTEPHFSPSWKVRVLVSAVSLLGPRRMRSVLSAFKVRGLSVYTRGIPHEHQLPHQISDVGKRHGIGSSASGNIRAAVFGINDGLISNASLIMGVAAAASYDQRTIVISGTAGLLAGALSMAAGEFVSVKSQRELIEYQLELEQAELDRYPEEEAVELALIYEARGIPSDQAMSLSQKLISDPARALDVLAREELGINPDDLGSPFGAAGASFVSFVCGAVLPLLPYLLANSDARSIVPYSLAITAIALFLTGGTVGFFSGRSVTWGGIRMLLIGGGAGFISYAIGGALGG